MHEDAKCRSTQYSYGFEAMPSLHQEARKGIEIKNQLTPTLTPESDYGRLPQLRVLRLGFLQDGDVGVGVFPESEEVSP